MLNELLKSASMSVYEKLFTMREPNDCI